MSGLTTFQKKSRHERYKVRDDDERRRWDSNPRALLHACPISSAANNVNNSGFL